MEPVAQQALVTSAHPTMNWGAIFSGWVLATGIAALLYVGGLALGFSAFDPRNTELIDKGIGIGGAIWVVLTWGGSLFLGALFASWFDGRNDAEMGAIRGLTVWGLAMSATGLLVVTGLAHVGFINVDAYSSVRLQGVENARAAAYTAKVMWIAFASGVVSLITSALGGWLGALHVRHVYHLRTYDLPRRV